MEWNAMLVLSRRPSQRIVLDLEFSELGDVSPENRRIEIVLVRSKSSSARIGVSAPRDVRVRRAELVDEPIEQV